MKTQIYACYLPGSETPDYIGSHKAAAPARDYSRLWKYAHCAYLGQGAWIHKETGEIIGFPNNSKGTPWGSLLYNMSQEERKAIRIETLATVDTVDRWKEEAQAIRKHKPKYNTLQPMTEEAKRGKYNAYHNGYRVGYYERNPAKLESKRKADRERLKAKRSKAKEAQGVTISHDA